uniref:GYF domain-containing protein n=1 Tax=Peronospora matthiolae TaxID=2874970 RepID=A0AAV1UNT7_9STRA
MAVTAFDLEEEKDEGHFDANGNFVWDDEARKQEEAWLEDVSEQQIGAAKHAKSQREFRDEQTEETLTIEAAEQKLATLLKPRETVLQALKRLGTKKKKKARARVGCKRKQRKEMETPTETPAETQTAETQTAEEKEQFNQITEAADFLLRSGEVDVYSQIKEEFVSDEELLAQRRQVQFVDTDTSEEKSEPRLVSKQEIMWEYKADDGHIHGPFPMSSYVAWRQQGYFTGETAVDMRQVLCGSDAVVAVEPAQKKLKQQEDEKVSAEQEMLDDFEDSDNDDNAESAADGDKAETNKMPWMRSDEIDFGSF